MENSKFNIYKNKNVLVTGSTGFKGSWLCLWLTELGANVTGFALPPPTNPSLFVDMNISSRINQYYNDIRDYEAIKRCIKETNPEFIFHLAAQPLVRESYLNPVDTLDINIMGTVYLLDAVRTLGLETNIICITSDKCYENQEWLFGYRENDPMGGYDTYSASKAAAELILNSYRNSFFNSKNFNNHKVRIASVRAGNVIGGGDWAKDRIIPDCIRSLHKKNKIFLRNPYATRPWQHVLEPLGGYLLLGSYLATAEKETDLNNYCSAFNFGPLVTSNVNVQKLVEAVLENWGDGDWFTESTESVHEASFLSLTFDKAYHLLNWFPVWNFNETIEETIGWYKCSFYNSIEIEEYTINQIKKYNKLLINKIDCGTI